MTNSLFIGKVFQRFGELPSTNDYAAELLAKSKPPEGTAIRADSQSAGRGQFGSRWESEAGKNLLLSVILYPSWLEAQMQFYLGMAVGLALRDTVHGTRHTMHGMRGGTLKNDEPSAVNREPFTVKWPNDLYLGSRKAAGILIQNALSGQHLQSSIVGIGLNVNQTEFDPALPNPTSLALFFGKNFDLDVVAERLFECLERRYLQLKAGRRADLKTEYESHLFRRGEVAQFTRTAEGSVFTGTIRGVTEAGRLQVEILAGEEETFEVKEVKFIL